MFLKIARQGSNRWYYYVLTVILVFLGMALFQMPLVLAGVYFYYEKYGKEVNPFEMQEYLESLNYTDIGIDLNGTLFLVLLGFVGGFLALWFFLKIFHKRKLKTLITPHSGINWSKIFFAFGLWMFFTIIIEVVSYALSPEDYTLQFNLRAFIPLLIISILVLPIQTTFEEILFRGYLMQGIALISKYRWIPLLVTSLMFGLMHIANPEVDKFGTGTMMFYYIGTGLFLGIITLMDDSLELALGIHAATNFYSSTIITFEGSALQTDAIFRTEVVNIELMLPVFFVSAALFTFICWRKYKWEGWHRAFGKVDQTDIWNKEEPSFS